jgi:hypothetical protein
VRAVCFDLMAVFWGNARTCSVPSQKFYSPCFGGYLRDQVDWEIVAVVGLSLVRNICSRPSETCQIFDEVRQIVQSCLLFNDVSEH